MELDVVTPTTGPLLTSLETVKARLGLTGTTGSDDALNTAIRMASDWASRFVGYPLVMARYRETVAGYGTRELMLARTPVRSVSSLFYGTDTGDDGDALQLLSSEFGLDREAGFLTRPDGWEWTAPSHRDYEVRPVPGQEFAPWLVDYVAGYTLGGLTTDSALWSTEKGSTDTGRTLPYDIEEAVVRKAITIHEGSDGVTRKSIGDLELSFGSNQSGGGQSADPAADMLRTYRRVV